MAKTRRPPRSTGRPTPARARTARRARTAARARAARARAARGRATRTTTRRARTTAQSTTSRLRDRRPASTDSVMAAAVVLWGNLFEEAATYALATNRELIALASGRAEPRDAMLRLQDLGQQYLARLSNVPRQVVEQFGVQMPVFGFSRRRQGHPRD